jgi:valyl-tRNA synthetase
MLTAYPDGSGLAGYPAEAEMMGTIMEIIRAVRNIRAEMRVPLGKKADILLYATAEQLESIKLGADYIRQLAGAADLQFITADQNTPEQAAKAHVRGVDIYLPLAGLIDTEKEVARLQKEIAACEAEIQRISGKLSNQGFLAKAPAEVVAKEQAKQAELAEKRASLEQHLGMFK